MRKNYFGKNDALLIAIIIFLALALQIYNSHRRDGGTIRVYSNGKFYGEYALSENTEIKVHNEYGGINTIMIQDGEASIIDADCPDKICVKSGGISKSGATILCIPNRLSMRVEGSGLDGITR